MIQVSYQAPPEEPPEIKNRNVRKLTRQIDPGGSSASMLQPVVAPVESPVTMEVPDSVTANSGEVLGADIDVRPGTGIGNGFGSGQGAGTRVARIGGIQVKAARLGVVLDVSGSMDDDLPKVRRELKKEFANAAIVEVPGCGLIWSGNPAFNFAAARRTTRMKPRATDVLEAVELLVAARQCDAIFWFSDLQDRQHEEAFSRLEHLLGTIEGSGRRPVRFYVRSVENKPGDRLMEVIERSGGGTR